MKYAHQFLVTTVSLIAIGAMLTVPLPAGAESITNMSLGPNTLSNITTGQNNTAFGYGALFKNTEGHHNTASGFKALERNTEGHDNTASGSHALFSNTTGNQNTASGAYALFINSTGSYNTASGYQALSSNTEGNYNTANGYHALYKNTTGRFNTAVGSQALEKNTEGRSNTAVGFYALMHKERGNGNTAVGEKALLENTTGSGNTAIGFQAGVFNSGNNNVFIGYGAGSNTHFKNVSNRLVVANGSNPSDALIVGDFDKHRLEVKGTLRARGSLMALRNLVVNGNAMVRGSIQAKMVKTTSDARLKKDIKPLTHALDSILQLEGKTYRWKEDTTFANKQDIGLVAQDVEKVFPELVAEDERGYKAIAYSKLTAVLIEAIKEQQGQMTEREARFTAQITTLEKENTLLKTIMAEQMDALLARVAMLEGESLAAN